MAEHREQREHRQQQGGGANMADIRSQYGYGGGYGQQENQRCNQGVKAAAAVTVGGSLLVLSGLTLVATVIGLTMVTPLLVIFSPVIVPALITVGLLVTGFVTSGGLGAAAVTVLSWIYKYVTGKQPPGSDQLDQAGYKIAGKARDMRDRAEQYGQQQRGEQYGQQQRGEQYGQQHTRGGAQAS